MGIFKYLILSILLIPSIVSAGTVELYIFNGELPASNVNVKIGDEIYKTGTDGILSLELSSGAYKALITSQSTKDKTIDFIVGAKSDSTMSVTLSDSDNNDFNIYSTKEKLTDSLKKETIFKGVIRDFTTKKAVPNVKVFIHGTGIEGKTNTNGEFSIEVPLGEFGISFIHKQFSTESIKNFEFKKIENNYNVSLKPSGMQLEDFVVISPNTKSSVSTLLDVRKSYSTVADLIGSEQMSKSGDSDAGSSLRRVTGLSLIDGKYVYVRGLGERYSNTLLNQSMLPSPDPSRRVVPLDLFPASVIENMVVQKGYSADMPGEFGGGIISIKTKTIPEKTYVKFSTSQELEDTSNLKTYAGSSNDWLGISGSKRKLPALLQSYLNKGKSISSLSPEERKQLAKSINRTYDTQSVSGKDRSQVPNFSISGGTKKRFNRVKLGFNMATLYSNKWSQDENDKANYNSSGNALIKDSEANVLKHKNSVKLGGLVGLGAKYKRHEFEYNGSILRNTNKTVSETNGINSEKEDYLKTELIWKERELKTHQLKGTHKIKSLSNAKLEWSLNESKATLDEPDNKMYTYKLIDGSYQLEKENGSSSNAVSWNSMEDKMSNIRLDYTQPIDNKTLKNLQVKAGYNYMKRSRKYESKNFYFQFGSSETKNNTDEEFNDPDAELYQQANETDNYSANQIIESYYTATDFNLGKLNINAGMRYEKSRQEVDSFKLFNQGKTISELNTRDYLPTISLNYKINSQMQIRASVSETVSRPDLREISKTIWKDDELGASFVGNPNLKSAEIENIDLRWEWYFNRGELLSLGVFQKTFTRPIEEIFGSLSDDGRIVGTTENRYTFLNIDHAKNRGIEFEFRKKLSNYFTFGGNYSLIDSQVSIAEDKAGQLTSLSRPLQGQSPYLLNLQLDFEREKSNTMVSLLYNVMGERITGVGADGRPDEYQSELASLDLVASQKINKNWKAKLKVKNILNPEIQRTQGNKVTRSFKNGQAASVGLSGAF